MKPILFENTETSFTSNGLGRIDAISCLVTEERNGQYDLEMDVSIDDEHFDDIIEGRLLYVRHDDTTDKQPFEIYYISRPINGIVTVLAHHISYRTQQITVMPFTASSCTQAMQRIKNYSAKEHDFELWTDRSATGKFTLEAPKSMRSLLAGESGSILDVYSYGEYEWDKFTIKFHSARGSDTGVVIRYGKDLTDLTKTTDTSNVWTGIVPYYYGPDDDDSSENVLVTLTEKYILADDAYSFAYDRIIPVDFTQDFDTVPTEAQLRTRANTYISNNKITSLPTSITFSFIDLAHSDEYEDVAALQRLKLCDTITVKYEKLGVSNKAKIVRAVYNVLMERYDSLTVGQVNTSLASAITGDMQSQISDLQTAVGSGVNGKLSTLEQEILSVIDEQTTLIKGGNGGYIVLKTDADGKPTEILAMDTDDVDTAVNVLRINVNGIGFSSTGVDGTYNTAWTIGGAFNANYITAGTLNANLIRTGVIQDVEGKNSWDMDTGDFTVSSTTTISGTGTTLAGIIEDIEDVDAKFDDYYQSSEVDTLLTAQESSILASVSTTYETKADAGTLQSTLETYADDAADDAEEAAISYTQTQLANYYTKTETDSTLTVMQNSITAAVSTANTASQTATTAKNTTITDDTIHYLATSASSGVSRSDSGWSTTVQNMTAANNYLWTYHTYTFGDDSTSDTDPVITGRYGADGADGNDGDDGVSITDVTPLYYVTDVSSAANVPSPTLPVTSTATTANTWTKALPALTSTYLYLYTCDQVTYSDGTYTNTTIVSDVAITDINTRLTAAEVKITDASIIATVTETNAGQTAINALIDDANLRGVSSYTMYARLGASTGDLPTAGFEEQPTDNCLVTAYWIYLWAYYEIEYSDGETVTTDPAIIYDASSHTARTYIYTRPVFYLSTSDTAPSAPTEMPDDTDGEGEWTITLPTVSADYPYLFTTDLIYNDDGTTIYGNSGVSLIPCVGTTSTRISHIRSEFAMDSTNITLSAGVDGDGNATGVITFNSGTFVVNSSNFSVTAAGLLTCTDAVMHGTFSAGDTSSTYIQITNNRLIGGYNGNDYSYINLHVDRSAWDSSAAYSGMTIYSPSSIFLQSPRIYVAASSASVTTLYQAYNGTYNNMTFVNGLLVSVSSSS